MKLTPRGCVAGAGATRGWRGQQSVRNVANDEDELEEEEEGDDGDESSACWAFDCFLFLADGSGNARESGRRHWPRSCKTRRLLGSDSQTRPDTG